jgi:hypothetical protein
MPNSSVEATPTNNNANVLGSVCFGLLLTVELVVGTEGSVDLRKAGRSTWFFYSYFY